MAASARIEELRQKFDENPRRFFAPLANEYRKAGDLSTAIRICRDMLARYPEHMSGYVVLGQALHETGELPGARETFERALELDPENLIALRHLGDIARLTGDAQGASEWYRRVLDADPRNDEVQALVQELVWASQQGYGGDAYGAAPDTRADDPFAPRAVADEYGAPSAASLEIPAAAEWVQGGGAPFEPLDLEPFEPGAPEVASAAGDVPMPWADDPQPVHVQPVDVQPVDVQPVDVAPPALDEQPSAAGSTPGWDDAAVTSAAAPDVASDGASDRLVPDGPTDFDPVVGLDLPPQALPLEMLTGFDEHEEDPDDAAAPPASAGAGAGVFVTETMADLLLQQGHVDRAAEVLEALAAQRPDDRALAARLGEVRARLAGATHPAAAGEDGAGAVAALLAGAGARAADETAARRLSDAFAAPVGEAGPSLLDALAASSAPAPAVASTAPGDLSFDRFFVGLEAAEAGDAGATGDVLDARGSAAETAAVASPLASPLARADGAPDAEDGAPAADEALVALPDSDDDLLQFNAWLRGLTADA